MIINPQIFEYRTNKPGNDPKQKRVLWLVAAIMVAFCATVLMMTFWRHGPDNINFLMPLQNSQQSEQGNGADYQELLNLIEMYLLVGVLPIWLIVASSKRRQLTLTEDELIHTLSLPFGLNALLPVNWRISLRDVTGVEFFQPAIFGQFSELAFTVAQLKISQRQGPTRVINPAMWFVPGSPSRAPLEPVAKSGFFSSGSGVWLRPENQEILRSAFANMPIVQALRDHGVAVPDPKLPSNYQDEDLFASKSVKFGVVAGMLLIITTLLTMIARPNLHLQASFPTWFYIGLGCASLLLLWAIGEREQRRPRAFHIILAVIFFVGGITGAAHPVTTLINGIGIDAGEQQTFVAHGGSLEPIGHQSGIGTIGPLGESSRLHWLKDGTTVTLTVTKGRFGLWEYDDKALRSMADAQGIK
jgi:hypothetical protein